MKSNCLIWAVRQVLTQGGWLCITKSEMNLWDWLFWPHFAWMPKDRSIMLHYVPPPEEYKKRIFPPLFFRGEVREKK